MPGEHGIFRADLHVHTRISSDGIDRPERVVEAAKRHGLHAIAITDHDRSAGYHRLVRLGLADPAGLPVDGLLVIPGVEVSTAQGHILVLGAAFDPRPGVTAEQTIARARALGAITAAAHPMDRSRSGVGAALIESLDVDAIEGWNSKTLSRAANIAAIRLAERRGLPIVGGSDAHFAGTVGRAHTLIEAGELSTRALLEAITAGRTRVVQGQHTTAELARYWVQGWLTRPWLLNMAGRGAQRAAAGVARRLSRGGEESGMTVAG